MTESGEFAAQEQFMRVALTEAYRALSAGESPVGACIVADGQVVAKARNAVITELDITAHAEICAIREACSRQRVLSLAHCQIYATVEPCTMCFGACYYAGISTIVFGATLRDMDRATGTGLAQADAERAGGSTHPMLVGDCLRDECVALLEKWALMRHDNLTT